MAPRFCINTWFDNGAGAATPREAGAVKPRLRDARGPRAAAAAQGLGRDARHDLRVPPLQGAELLLVRLDLPPMHLHLPHNPRELLFEGRGRGRGADAGSGTPRPGALGLRVRRLGHRGSARLAAVEVALATRNVRAELHNLALLEAQVGSVRGLRRRARRGRGGAGARGAHGCAVRRGRGVSQGWRWNQRCCVVGGREHCRRGSFRLRPATDRAGPEASLQKLDPPPKLLLCMPAHIWLCQGCGLGRRRDGGRGRLPGHRQLAPR
mmetsp:Transcript_119029/g.384335  ORF Transcript_119029/g.384335 Transcript_119029/m.384335 type:complete len:266 (+) Transcript_119029:1025-1822(+)